MAWPDTDRRLGPPDRRVNPPERRRGRVHFDPRTGRMRGVDQRTSRWWGGRRSGDTARHLRRIVNQWALTEWAE